MKACGSAGRVVESGSWSMWCVNVACTLFGGGSPGGSGRSCGFVGCGCMVDLSHVAPWPSGTLSGMTSAGPEPEDSKSVVRELVLHVMMLEMMVLKLVLVMVVDIVCGWSRSGAAAVVERSSSATKSISVGCIWSRSR